MAKRARGRGRRAAKAAPDTGEANSSTARTIAVPEDIQGGALGDFAEDLGRLLGNTERKASEWLSQRTAVAETLIAIRDKADSLLSQLGVASSTGTQARRRSPPATTRPAGGRRGGGAAKKSGTRVVSAETRAKMSEAARRRWAGRNQGR